MAEHTGDSPGRDRSGDDRWWLVAGLLPGLLVALPRVVAGLWADRVPDPIAVHWDVGGVPNGSMSLAANEAFATALGILFWAIGGSMVARARAWRVRRAVAAVTTGTLGFLAILDVAVLAANLGQTSWQDARLPGWSVLLALAGAAALGGAAWALAGRPPEVDVARGGVPLTSALPSAGLSPQDVDAHWEGSSANAWLAVLGVVLGGACLVGAAVVTWWLLVPGVVVLLACATTCVLHVRCDVAGMAVRFGVLGWPVQRIPLAGIESARAVDLDPAEWGGWGYRWAPGQNGTAAVTRRGPAIVVQRADGRRFAVTVDDAVTGAGVLNDLRGGLG